MGPWPDERGPISAAVAAAPVALVTGGACGIGSATCDAFAAAGLRVVVADVDGAAAAAKAAELAAGGAAALGVAADVTETPSTDAMVAAVMDSW